MIQLYTGNGKGKTTAALGQALRAAGHGMKVLVIQFMKGDPGYGELKSARLLPNLTIIQSGRSEFVTKGAPTPEDLRLARAGFELARKALRNRDYHMVVLDEINVAVDYGLLPLGDVLELARSCPADVELVFTGRYAPPELVEIADLVSDVREVKHPFARGVAGRAGIEF